MNRTKFILLALTLSGVVIFGCSVEENIGAEEPKRRELPTIEPARTEASEIEKGALSETRLLRTNLYYSWNLSYTPEQLRAEAIRYLTVNGYIEDDDFHCIIIVSFDKNPTEVSVNLHKAFGEPAFIVDFDASGKVAKVDEHILRSLHSSIPLTREEEERMIQYLEEYGTPVDSDEIDRLLESTDSPAP